VVVVVLLLQSTGRPQRLSGRAAADAAGGAGGVEAGHGGWKGVGCRGRRPEVAQEGEGPPSPRVLHAAAAAAAASVAADAAAAARRGDDDGDGGEQGVTVDGRRVVFPALMDAEEGLCGADAVPRLRSKPVAPIGKREEARHS